MNLSIRFFGVEFFGIEISDEEENDDSTLSAGGTVTSDRIGFSTPVYEPEWGMEMTSKNDL